MTRKDKEILLELILKKAFQYNKEPIYELASGKMSNYYLDCKPVTFQPEGKYVIGNIIFELIKNLNVRGVGGLTLGADPIAHAVAHTSYIKGNPIEAFVVRKKQKTHGIIKWIEGNVKKGDRVVIVDDVITTGESTIEAINRAKEEGLEIVKVIALVDRQEGGREAIESLGYKFDSIITRDELMELYKSKQKSSSLSSQKSQINIMTQNLTERVIV